MPPSPTPDPLWILKVLGDASLPKGRFTLAAGEHTVGSNASCAIHLPADGVSRLHAKIEALDGGLVVHDLDSKNGTWLGSRRIDRALAGPGTRLRFGSLSVEVQAHDPQGLAFAGGRGGGVRASSSGTRSRTGQRADQAPHRLDHSTLGLSIEERLLRSLRPLAEGIPRTLDQIVVGWMSDLLLERVEVVRTAKDPKEEILASVAGPEVERPPDLELRDDDLGVGLRLWGGGCRRLRKLGPHLELTLALVGRHLAGPGRPHGVTVASETESGRGEPSTGVESTDEAPGPPPPGTLSPTMVRAYARVAKVAAGEIPILVLGASGTGKEVMARFVHRQSKRSAGPFVALNCAALPSELLEAELFGIERGVATGVDARRGLVEEAHGGTLFLDELGDMALETQAKVLRAIENRQIFRVGGRTAIDVDVRFVAATHQDLARRIEDGAFRHDLYHRLAAHVVHLPALADRAEDIALLAGHFFARRCAEAGIQSPGMTRSALAALARHPWPGNIRELSNEIAQAVLLLEPGEPLDLEHLSDRLRAEALDLDDDAPLSLVSHLQRAERTAYATALAAAGGDPARAIEQLGVSRATFYRKLKELGLKTGSDG